MEGPRLAPGLRRTRQRQLVWEAVRELGSHHTADEIASHLQRREPGFSRSTVYRALEALTASAALRAVRLGSGPTYYECATEEHQHAVCQTCQGVLHLEADLVSQVEDHLRTRHRFLPLRTEVLVVGICDTCARSGPRRRPRRRVLEHVHFDVEEGH
jgi:Fe2+ or Zn2+ uptake regulation protein